MPGEKPEFASSIYTAGKLNAMVKQLRKHAGPEAVEMLLAGELEVKPDIPQFTPRVWHSIQLGVGAETPSDFRAPLEEAGYLPDWDVSVYSGRVHLRGKNFVLSGQVRTLNLFRVSGSQLGFKRSMVPYEDILNRASVFGLEPVPAEAGPQLCLQFPARAPESYFYYLAMTPLLYEREARVFLIKKDSTGKLFRSVQLDQRYRPSQEWIFCQK